MSDPRWAIPPSIAKMVPVVQAERSDAGKSTVAALGEVHGMHGV